MLEFLGPGQGGAWSEAVTATEIRAREDSACPPADRRPPTGCRPSPTSLPGPGRRSWRAVPGGWPGPCTAADDECQDSISDSPMELATTAEMLNRAEAASRETLFRIVNPDWDDTRVQTEVDAILAESGRSVSDPMMSGAEAFQDASDSVQRDSDSATH